MGRLLKKIGRWIRRQLRGTHKDIATKEWANKRSVRQIKETIQAPKIQNRRNQKEPELFSDFFKLVEVLGSGSFATVHVAVHRATKDRYAVKIVPKKQLKDSKTAAKQLKLEISVLKAFQGPSPTNAGIVQLHSYYEDANNVYIVMEKLAETLDERMERRPNNKLSERETYLVMKQLLTTIDILHKSGHMHSDIKAENIMLARRGRFDSVKLIDFGLGKKFKPGQIFKTPMGTAQNMAPENICGCYTHAADIWSLGVLMYSMLSGFLPFEGKTYEDIATSVCSSDIDFSSIHGDRARDMVACMMERKPYHRWNAHQLLEHPWMNKWNRKIAHEQYGGVVEKKDAMISIWQQQHQLAITRSPIKMITRFEESLNSASSSDRSRIYAHYQAVEEDEVAGPWVETPLQCTA